MPYNIHKMFKGLFKASTGGSLWVLGFVILTLVVLAVKHRPRTRKELLRSTQATHLLQFPPSRRHVLDKVGELPPDLLQKRALPSTHAVNLGGDDLYTPTGFSTRDIRALGRFPDYAKLSGIRYPTPYVDFDVTKARFRPFRPFRWNYHQTMCKRLTEHQGAESLLTSP